MPPPFDNLRSSVLLTLYTTVDGLASIRVAMVAIEYLAEVVFLPFGSRIVDTDYSC
jgi:hypothetical protein